MNKYIEKYKDYLKNIRKVAPNTLESYLRDVNNFYRYLEDSNLDFNKAKKKDIENYFSIMKDDKKSNSTLTRTLSSIRSFYSFLIFKEYLTDNPTVNIKIHVENKKNPYTLSHGEISLLLSIPDIKNPKGIRDRAMIELLYATGIKVSELVDLNTSDINFELGMLRCRSLNKYRNIPIYTSAVNIISRYFTDIRPKLTSAEEKSLFVNMKGNRLTRQGFWKIIRQYSEQSGMDEIITPHTLRHTFAIHLLENGAKLKDVQKMLGHADISSTQIYLNILKDRFKNVYEQYHPMANNN